MGIFTKSKKNFRRRSNWYVYLISFAATTLLLVLIVFGFRDVLFPQNSARTTDQWRNTVFTPNSDLDTTVLFMMSDSQGSAPRKYMLMNYRPADEVIVLVPLNADTKVTTTGRSIQSGRLTDLFTQGGAPLAAQGIADTLGLEVPFYVQLDRSSFTSFTSDLGEVTVNIPFDFSGGGIATLFAGEHKLTGGDLFIYMTQANFPQAGANYDLVIMGSVISTLINSNLRNLDDETIQTTFMRILNNANTNLTNADFRHYQQALRYTSQVSVNPAGFYFAPGAYESNEFVLTEQAIAEILKRFNQS
jgi:anionic cell wall polymer biosynthesis LytR-Cps2A-Psr (LCP) family protein